MINTIDRSKAILVVMDVQERMMPAIDNADARIDKITRLVRGCVELRVPVLVTEQYSKGLGPTVAPIREALGEKYNPLEKMTFSAAKDLDFMQAYDASGKHHLLICGVEAHVCVYQTARDLFNLGWTVEVIGDATGSRTEQDRRMAFIRMGRHGVDISSVEMALFDMMESAEAEEFRSVAAIIK